MATIDTNDIFIDGDISVGGNIINSALRNALDGYGDGYIEAIRSVFVDSASGSFSYDTMPVPTFRQSNSYWQCATLDGDLY